MRNAISFWFLLGDLGTGLDRPYECVRVCHRPKDAALHLDHVVRCNVIGRVGGSRAVREQQALVPAHVCVAGVRTSVAVGLSLGSTSALPIGPESTERLNKASLDFWCLYRRRTSFA